MREIRVALIGVGNCASALVQGVHHYGRARGDTLGLAHPSLGGYQPSSIRFVAAFDVDSRKVGRDLSEAIFAPPNCASIMADELSSTGAIVKMGPPL
ncbi:MAG: inositol-3-phosphate synthase, partial [Phycisphaerales bacterium]|nr:inositol-3-phosphate synthase [Phycisphaerales bacterium]